jgi:hypothetical protein
MTPYQRQLSPLVGLPAGLIGAAILLAHLGAPGWMAGAWFCVLGFGSLVFGATAQCPKCGWFVAFRLWHGIPIMPHAPTEACPRCGIPLRIKQVEP